MGFEQALIQDARAAAAATSLDAVAQKTAAIAAHCGDCHQAAGLSPNPPARLPATTKTGDQSTLQAGMSAHAHAEEQLWRGLMRPALADFRAASNTLAEATILPTGTGADSPLPQEVTDLEVAVHDLAARAARTEAPADRARFYGEILATCGACHRSLGRGPAADGNTASPTQP